MKPMNKCAAKCRIELIDNKYWATGNNRRLIVRRFWKKQASKANRVNQYQIKKNGSLA